MSSLWAYSRTIVTPRGQRLLNTAEVHDHGANNDQRKQVLAFEMFILHRNRDCCCYLGWSVGTFMLDVCENAANLKINKLEKCLYTRKRLLFENANMEHHVSKVHRHTERRAGDKYLCYCTCKTHSHTLSCIQTVHVRLEHLLHRPHTHISTTDCGVWWCRTDVMALQTSIRFS